MPTLKELLDRYGEADIAETIARSVVTNWQAVPWQIVKEYGETVSMHESSELADAALWPDAFSSAAVHQQVHDRVVELLDEMSGGSCLWWSKEEPELNAESPITTIINKSF